ncbi:hypothetical protein LTR97_001963 [Elasticomyces elasticus]|uniref:Nucleoside phosphorylase domain-containing protein n=1 Tax=Elasticomyces elasticus TaxID=574655 RepID=A0AAN7WA46_9PEZI|nr:hypothetical protein LTR97_001963 [Elasticomyces elasticus]
MLFLADAYNKQHGYVETFLDHPTPKAYAPDTSSRLASPKHKHQASRNQVTADAEFQALRCVRTSTAAILAELILGIAVVLEIVGRASQQTDRTQRSESSSNTLRNDAMALPTRPRESYTVGIICALDVEKAAVEAIRDEEHSHVRSLAGDNNSYAFGQIGQHDVVIACLPAGITGKASAATVANNMMRSFPIKVGFMVGIGGGVPNDTTDVRLGDVVVSEPAGMHGGVVQWDFGKMEKKGFRRTNTLNKPPIPLLNALQDLKSKRRRLGSGAHQHFKEMMSKFPRMQEDYSSPGQEHDDLFEAGYSHPSGNSCIECDRSKLKQRLQRTDDEPRTHYGNIASGDEVVKDGPFRDRVAQEEGIICFEMEAAGLMDNFPCVVIRGICDYADSHKNKRWQPYAAATAACYCKELLGVIEPQNIAELDLASSEKYRIPFELTGIPATRHFVQRDVPMKQLETFFLPTSQPTSEPASTPSSRKVFVVYGLGGIGKTQLCVAFARKYQEDFSAILWLDGSSEDAVRQSLANAYQRLPATFKTPTVDIQGSIDGLLQWLSLPDNTGWLLIFDNVDRDLQFVPKDPQAFNYRSFLPSADHGSILVTTRLSRMQIPKASLQLLRLDDRCAREMLEDWVDKKLLDVDKLLEKLGGLPLALVQAGAYLRETNTSIEEYLESYERTWTSLMEFQEKYPAPDYQERTMLTTWNMSYEQVRAVNPQAVAILDQWAFLYAGDIWFELAASSPQNSGQDHTAEVVTMIATDKLAFRNSLGVLANYSLITAHVEGTGFSIHPVVHAWCLHTVARAGRLEQLCDRALVLVVRMIPSEADGGHWNIERRLVPHARAAAARHLDGAEKEDFNDEIVELARFLSDWASSADVEALYLRALRGYVKVLGEDHASTLKILNNIGVLYAEQGRIKEAEEMYWRALGGNSEARVLRYTPTGTTVTTLDNLGRLYVEQGKIKDAEDMYLRALSIGEKVWGPEQTTTSFITTETLSILYISERRFKEAVEMLLRVLQGFEETLGPKHRETLSTVGRLGSLYADQGKYEDAEEMFKRALQGLEETRGAKHTSTLDAVVGLGGLYTRQSKNEEAEEMYTRALQGFEETLGAKHSSTLNVVYNLGGIYDDQGKHKEAEEMLVRAWKGLEEMYGLKNMWTLTVTSNLGTYYRDQGRYKEAEKMYMRALQGFEEMYSPKHWTTLKTVRQLGFLYHEQGELSKARTMYTRAAEGYEHLVGDHEAEIRYLQENFALLQEDECNLALAGKVTEPIRKVGKRDRVLRFFRKRG